MNTIESKWCPKCNQEQPLPFPFVQPAFWKEVATEKIEVRWGPIEVGRRPWCGECVTKQQEVQTR